MNYEPDISLDEPTIRVDGVNHGYISGENVLGDLNIELNSGSFTFLTGPSGSGKTTLLQLLYAAQKPRNGKVSLFGVDTSNATRKTLTRLRRRIGVVYQDFRLLNHLTAYENAALPLRVTGKHEREYRDDVIDLLNWVGLGDRITAKPTTLSGGEQQRVAIARALVNKPDLLIADEPTGNVDPEMGERLMRLILELNRRLSTTVLIATHDIALVDRLGAPVVRLENGLLVHQRGDVGAGGGHHV
ncbi:MULTISPECIES: cell division ATP-binding protein FtsE [Ponticaulis]|jgi:cell division transport system ATP-binding protein|uniref:cell division ATP-binding protein FtsE n=1 Tax=Ponticaulis TaxID=1123044 RepID=UPI0003B4388A|nr:MULTISPECIES: ATP-binding cassette domain-containing protein [Ponticaulis]MBN05056.1 cell division ATP-binding protein FtsE [Ponticaulis sp.]